MELRAKRRASRAPPTSMPRRRAGRMTRAWLPTRGFFRTWRKSLETTQVAARTMLIASSLTLRFRVNPPARRRSWRQPSTTPATRSARTRRTLARRPRRRVASPALACRFRRFAPAARAFPNFESVARRECLSAGRGPVQSASPAERRLRFSPPISVQVECHGNRDVRRSLDAPARRRRPLGGARRPSASFLKVSPIRCVM